MKINKKGNQYQITYRCPGYEKVINEAFTTQEEAELRAAQVQLDKRRGTLLPPASLINADDNLEMYREVITLEQLLNEHIEQYGRGNWSARTLTDHVHNAKVYIVPQIGKIPIKALTTKRLEKYYQDLMQQPAIKANGSKSNKNISRHTVEKIHALIRGALNQAIRWDYLRGANPAMSVQLPRKKKKQREAWTEAEAAHALQVCEDPTLKLCMLLALGCSLRISEILGLTWDCVHFKDIANGIDEPYIEVTKQLQRIETAALNALGPERRDEILYTFPMLNSRANPTTKLVLKTPKTDSSIRRIYLPGTVEAVLRDARKKQLEDMDFLKEAYDNFNLVICLQDGRPIEADRIRDRFNALIEENHLRKVVFHSLRHSSTTIKLKLSGGDIKAVQGDTGHAQADMVTDIYSHITDADRVNLAKQVDKKFFGADQESQRKNVSDDKAEQLISLIRESPEMAETLLQVANLVSAGR